MERKCSCATRVTGATTCTVYDQLSRYNNLSVVSGLMWYMVMLLVIECFDFYKIVWFNSTCISLINNKVFFIVGLTNYFNFSLQLFVAVIMPTRHNLKMKFSYCHCDVDITSSSIYSWLQNVPAGDWFCPDCRPKSAKINPRKVIRTKSFAQVYLCYVYWNFKVNY